MDPEVSLHSPDEETAMPDQITKCQSMRSMRSLNVLATRFVKLLQEAEDGVLDLKEVSEQGPVRQQKQQTLIPQLEMIYHVWTIFFFFFIN